MLKHVVLMTGLVVCGSITSVPGEVGSDRACGEDLAIMVTGQAKGKPDTMYLELASEATAGNSADAFEQCKQKAEAAAKAIADLGIPDSEIVREMYEFSSPTAGAAFAAVQPTAVPAGTKVSQVIKVKVKMSRMSGMDKLADTISRVFDAANKAGVGFKQPSPWQVQVTGQSTTTPVRYVLEDATALMKDAIADSVGKASDVKDALAKSGVQAGKLLGIRYSQIGRANPAAYWLAGAADIAGPGERSASSSSPEEVTVSCSLTFRYEVAQTTDR